MSELSIAVIGAGAAGLTAAYTLQSAHRVTIFERSPRLGGHAHTIPITTGPDAGAAFDVGFMVMNDRNYPTLERLFDRLGGIPRRGSEMSFGYQSKDGATQYAINWRPGYATMPGAEPRLPDGKLLGEVLKFFRHGTRDLLAGSADHLTFGAYLAEKGFSEGFVEGYAVPVGASIWSCAPGHLLDSPAAFVLRFYHHHGMLSLDEGPRWQTVVGGSRTYVEAIRKSLLGPVVAGAANLKIRRTEDGIYLEGAAERFDRVVVATHADQALALLADPSPEESAWLGAWRYEHSRALLHSDASVMPSDRGAWASWNYVQADAPASESAPMITYHLDRLQGQTGLSASYFLSLNPDRPIDPTLVHAELAFEHPIYTLDAVATQSKLAALNGTRHTYYCGSYMGYGFHEDAVRSGGEVGAALGCPL